MTVKWLRESIRIRTLLFTFTLVSLVLLFPSGESLDGDSPIGSVWIKDDLIATVSFPVIKDPELYRKEMEAAKNQVYPIFFKQDKPAFKAVDSVNNFFNIMIEQLDNNIPKDQWIPSTRFVSDKTFNTLQALRKSESKFTDADIPIPRLMNYADSVIAVVCAAGFLSLDYNQIERDSIAVRSGNYELISPKSKYPELSSAKVNLQSELKKRKFPQNVYEALLDITEHYLLPEIVYSSEQTRKEIEQRQKKIQNTSGLINENEKIVAKHDKVTPDVKLKIDSYRSEKGKVSGLDGTVRQFIGKTIHVFTLIFLLGLFFYYFRKNIYRDNLLLSIFAIMIVWTGLVTFLLTNNNLGQSFYLLIFIPTASMILTIIFDSRVAIFATIIISLLCAALRSNEYSFAVSNITAGLLAIYTVRDIKYRSQIFRSMIYIFLGYAASILMFGLENLLEFKKIFIDLGFAAISAVISPVLTFGLLIFFEKIFNIVTDLTLLELTNPDLPLLRSLMQVAPGTFNHSMSVAALAEAAADRIEANPLLARVGAYYHDIGKMERASDFVENQRGVTSVHKELKPEESVLIILRHVKDGIELGRNYRIPEKIIDFIPTHHGTSVIKFFHRKAIELYGEGNIDINQYRYPGPKPSTKETGILMLADTCESASRTLDEPDRQSLTALIEKLVDEKLDDGQLSESPLTFKDLSMIKESFIDTLLSQRHARIKYPAPTEQN